MPVAGLRSLRALPRFLRPTEPSDLRALWLAGCMARAALRRVLRAPAGVCSRARRHRVRQWREIVRALLEGARAATSRCRCSGARCGGDLDPRRGRAGARSGRSGTRLGARSRRARGAGTRSGQPLAASCRRPPAKVAPPSAPARSRPRGAASKRARQCCRGGRRPTLGVLGRRRLHLGRDRRRVRIRSASRRRAPCRGGHLREGSSLD